MADSAQIDTELVDRFKNDWRSGTPEIEDYLPKPIDEGFLPSLCELVIIDMEFRWKACSATLDSGSETTNVPMGVEWYVREFPLLDSPETIERLVRNEYSIRWKFGDRPPRESFHKRYPRVDLDVETIHTTSETPRVQPAKSRNHYPVIDNFTLEREIGEGGMGSVFLAQQEAPVRRRVAIKVIRGGTNSREVIARFEAERQALALMDHPNIARIHEAGTTQQGQPFFAMELVNGIPISDFCNKHKLGIVERLELFNEVCGAIQHAHQKAILHRDLKPSNVLVSMNDGVPTAKVIDFGLAKALDANENLSDQAVQTQAGQVMGTLKYMSPEQASTQETDIDTRADVYALGVMLYELLTGGTPLDDISIRELGLFQLLEHIREKEPIRPSVKLATSEDSQTVADQLGVTSAMLEGVLRGDLDWIVMRALDKDRERRYETPVGLAEDIRRYLNHDPVLARPPSASYRFRKFVRKNRLLVGTAGTMFALLILGITATTVQAVRASRAEGEASRQERIAVAKAIEADSRRAEAEQHQKEAEQQEQEAWDARDDARREQRESRAQRDLARSLSALNRKQLYFSQMNVATAKSTTDDDVGRAQQMLSRWIPKTDESDLRGWEWYYLYGICHNEEDALAPMEGRTFATQWSSDGSIIHIGRDYRSRLCDYDGKSFKLVHEVRLNTFARDACWSPDETKVAVRGTDKKLRVLSWPAGKTLWEKPDRQGEGGLVWSHNGNWIAYASNRPNTVSVCNAKTGKEVHSFGDACLDAGIAFHPSKNLLAYSTLSETKVVDVSTKKTVHKYPIPWSNILAFNSDGSKIVGRSSAGKILAVDCTTSEIVLETPMPQYARKVVWNPKGQIGVGCRNGTAYVVDDKTGKITHRFRGHRRWVETIALSPDGKRLVSGGIDDYPRIWKLTDSGDLELETNYWTCAAWSPDSELVAIGDWKELQFWNVSERAIVSEKQKLEFESELLSIDWSPDGKLIGVVDRFGLVVLVDPTSASISNRLSEPGKEELRRKESRNRINWSQDGSRVAAQTGYRSFAVWDAKTKQLVFSSHHNSNVISVSLSANGQQLAVGGEDGVRVYELESGEVHHPIKTWAYDVAWSKSDPSQLITNAEWELYGVFEIDPSAPNDQNLFRGASRTCTAFAVSPDGTRLAGANANGSIYVWDTDTRSLVGEFEDFSNRAVGVAWSPDCTRLLSYSEGKIRIHDGRFGMDRLGHPKSLKRYAKQVRDGNLQNLQKLIDNIATPEDHTIAIQGIMQSGAAQDKDVQLQLSQLLQDRGEYHRSIGMVTLAKKDETENRQLLQRLAKSHPIDPEVLTRSALAEYCSKAPWCVLRATDINSRGGAGFEQDRNAVIRLQGQPSSEERFVIDAPQVTERWNTLRLEVLPSQAIPNLKAFQLSSLKIEVQTRDGEYLEVPIVSMSASLTSPNSPLFDFVSSSGVRGTGWTMTMNSYARQPHVAVVRVDEKLTKGCKSIRIQLGFGKFIGSSSSAFTEFKLSVNNTKADLDELVQTSMLGRVKMEERSRAALALGFVGRFEKAKDVLDVDSIDPTDKSRDRLVALAAILAKSGAVDQAHPIALQAMSIDDSKRWGIGHWLFGFDLTNTLIKADFSDDVLIAARGTIRSWKSDPVGAIEDFKRVDIPGKWTKLADIYEFLKDHDNQIECEEKYLEMYPDAAYSHQRLALALWRKAETQEKQNRGKEAIDTLRQAREVLAKARNSAKMNPNDRLTVEMLRNVTSFLADYLYIEKREAEARVAWKALLDVSRESALLPGNESAEEEFAWHIVVCPYEDLRDIDGAAVMAKRAVKRSPKSWSAWNTLAVAEYRAGRYDESLSAFEKAQNLAGSSPYDWYFRAMLHHKLGDKKQSEFWMRRARRKHDAETKSERAMNRIRDEAIATLAE